MKAILSAMLMTMEEKSKQQSNGECKGCGTKESKPLLNNKGVPVYWFAALKGTKDFNILTSALEFSFISTMNPNYPDKNEKFDFYCSDCFKLQVEQESEEDEE